MDGLKDYRDTFLTEALICTYLNGHYCLLEDRRAIFKPPKWILIFHTDDYYKYKPLCNYLGIWGLSPDELGRVVEDFNSGYYKVRDNKIVVLKFDPNFFELKGKRNKKIRYFRNYYSRLNNLEIFDKPQNINDIGKFLQKWKSTAKHATYPYIIGIDKNFFRKFAFKNSDKFINRFFYLNDELVGYSVIEKISNTEYNHLIRKADRTINHMSLYIDLMVYNEIYQTVGTSFLVNLGESGGQENLIREKTENFPVHQIYDTHDLFIILTKEEPEDENGISVSIKVKL